MTAPSVGGFPLPALLARRWQETASEGDPAFRDWLARLPAEVERIAEAWGLVLSAPFCPGGSCSWVAPTRGPDGADLVLKVTWAHEESRDEAAGLLAWQGHGAVHVERCETRGSTTALLLERCLPGTPLAEALPETAQDEVIARLLRGVWIDAPAGGPFRSLTSMCAWWADAAEARLARQPDVLPADVAERGLALFRDLPLTAPRTTLLVTDLHAGNVLLSTEDRRGARWAEPTWRLIDPKPYVGDPHYDITQHLLNCPEQLAGDPVALVDRMARLCGLDGDRARAWAFARCVQEAGVMDGAARAALRLAEVVPR